MPGSPTASRSACQERADRESLPCRRAERRARQDRRSCKSRARTAMLPLTDKATWQPAARGKPLQTKVRRSNWPTSAISSATSHSPAARGSSSSRTIGAAPSSPAWITRNDYRGWDLWVQSAPRRHAHHQRVARRRVEGGGHRRRCKATSGPTSPSPTTAPEGGRREGLLQRRGAEDERRGRQALSSTIKTKVPFKLGQRHTATRSRA